MRPGRVVVLNGTASAGKTSLAGAIRQHAPGMWVVIAQDDFAANLIPRWVTVEGVLDGGNGDVGSSSATSPNASDGSGRARTGSCSSGSREATTSGHTQTFGTTWSST